MSNKKEKNYIVSIIIPQYKETEEQMSTLFEMLNRQENIDFNDFEVIVVNDHSDFRISNAFFAKYKNLNIKSLQTSENVGSGLCRQYGVDHSLGKFLWFIDADDTLHNLLSVYCVLSYIKGNPKAEVIQGQFLQEVIVEGTNNHIYSEKDSLTWLHSKIYNRKFLEKYKIVFPKELRVSEDCYFNTVALNLAKNVVKVKEALTIYRMNPNSITNSNNREFSITGYPDYIISQEMALQKLKDLMELEDYYTLIVRMYCFFYFNAQKEMFLKNDKPEYMERINSLIILFYLKHKEEIATFSEKQFNSIYNLVRDTMINDSKYREKETITQFYNRIIKEISKN